MLDRANYNMIILGRVYRGLSQNELAKELPIGPAQLCKIEKGLVVANSEVIDSISTILNLPTSFFFRKGSIFPANLYYRKKSKASVKVLSKAEAEMNIHRLNIQELLDSVEINAPQLPHLEVEDFESPRSVAKQLRQLWRLPRGPIQNLVSVLEKNGIIIIPMDFGTSDVSGHSMLTEQGNPMIFINKQHPVDRQRFTLAHELCHLILHINHMISDFRDIEKEADQFASEFLIPNEDIQRHFTGYLNLMKLADLKRHWKVSMQAILYNARDNGLITQTNYKSVIIEMSKLRMKLAEPIELEPEAETPVILSGLINMHLNDLEMSYDELVQILALPKNEIEEKYLNLKSDRKKLRLVV